MGNSIRRFLRRISYLRIVLWLTVFAAVTGGCGGGQPPENVVLIVVDTLRADHVGVYGASIATPNIDDLAARGVTFRQAYAQIPITGPSHSSLFTSLLPFEHSVHNNGQILDPKFRTLAEILRDNARNTAAVISLGVLKRKFEIGRGFEVYRDEFGSDWMKDAGQVNQEVFEILEGGFMQPFFLWVHYSDPHEPYAPPTLEYPKIPLALNGVPIGELTAGGRGQSFEIELQPGVNHLRFRDAGTKRSDLYRLTNIRLDDRSFEVRPPAKWKTREKRVGQPAYQGTFPATVELVNPGSDPRPAVLETACKRVLKRAEIAERYALEVEYVDRQIGLLLSRLRELELLENTLVVFASDHGEGLGEHNHVGHISQLYDSLLRVPLIMSFPGRLPEGVVIQEPVSLIDVLPTISELLVLPKPESASGVSLLPLIHGAKVESRPIYGVTYRPEAYADKQAVVARGYKYIHSRTDDREWEELYDLHNDPGEIQNLAPSASEILDELRSKLRERVEGAAMAEVNEAELSEEEIKRLRELGYIH
ncbi:MAG: sulfatase-like hydrolase/transferase [Acidobacteria bacterium]|nr:sulfatase-like hydrolase/transferase [Acidobacteriota bacterium]